MKPHFSLLISILSFLLFLQMPHFAKADMTVSQSLLELTPVRCENAAPMNCQLGNYLNSNFLNQGNDALISQESCVEGGEQAHLSEYWLLVSLSGSSIYYIDGYGVNGGMEIYTGSCDSLVMVDCQRAMGYDTFLGFFPPVSAQYYIRVLGYEIPTQRHFEIAVNCGLPEPTCAISIDNVEVGTCVSDSGTVSLIMSGSLNPAPSMPIFYAEVVTDMGFYAFSGECENGLWEASFDVSGSVINYVAVFCGDSETGCSDSQAGTSLPIVLCDSLIVPSFIGSVPWNLNCGRRSGEVKLYETGNDIQLQSYSVFVLSNGLFEIENPPSGNFDMILKVDGFLPKGFSNVELPLTENLFDCGSLISGDVNNDGVINILDVSLIISGFHGLIPEGSLSTVDLNCDGIIDVLDISAIIATFGEIGDTVPLH